MTPAEMDAVLDRHFAAEAAHDLEGVLATLTPDAEHDVAGQGVLVGHEAIAERYRVLFAQGDEEKYEPVRRYHGDDFVVDEVLATQLIANDDFGPQARGKTVTYRLLHVCEFRDGLMTRENVWLDLAGIMAQVSS
ncbi:nuclear transport factor 2 family protein [Kribbella sp. NPDC058245]|uniref:nuclear transport factor 2 family protein n=1 Tax=Kribbella sp. NPDC058245 TaxID=3346399 RepID=UPI0036ED55F8